MKQSWYAVYKGDKFICQGTKQQCADYLGVKPKTIYFISSAVYLKRCSKFKSNDYLVAIKVEDI